jgi:hypothetical protein
MATAIPRELPELLGRADLPGRGPHTSVLVHWLQYLKEERGDNFLRQNGPSLLRAWEDFLRACWP